MSKKNGEAAYYDYAELIETNGQSIEQNNNKLIKPEELDLEGFISLLKIAAEKANDSAKPYAYRLIKQLETDEGNLWKLPTINIVKLLQITGYYSADEIVEAVSSLCSMDKYNEYVERKRRNSILGRLKSKVGRIISPKKAEELREERAKKEEQSKAEEQQAATEE